MVFAPLLRNDCPNMPSSILSLFCMLVPVRACAHVRQPPRLHVQALPGTKPPRPPRKGEIVEINVADQEAGEDDSWLPAVVIIIHVLGSKSAL